MLPDCTSALFAAIYNHLILQYVAHETHERSTFVKQLCEWSWKNIQHPLWRGIQHLSRRLVYEVCMGFV